MWSSGGENEITLMWQLNCVDDPIVKGYNISYCVLDSSNLDVCNEAIMNDVVVLDDDEERSHHVISNLKSYKLYNVSIALMSVTRLGPSTFPITVRTLEAGELDNLYSL